MTWRVLDLFCGAGGAAMGLHRAWPDAEIIGIDNRPQPRYPFTFVLGDALNPPFDLREFDFIWASPPCQAYTFAGTRARNEMGKSYPDLVKLTREMLEQSGRLYVIENVIGAPIQTQITLCGEMFGLKVLRHRNFESNRLLLQPPHIRHEGTPGDGEYFRPTKGGSWMKGTEIHGSVEDWREAMGIGWMQKKEIGEAIPPAYSEYIAWQIRP